METLPTTCMKYMLFSLNFFIWLFGLALLILGIWFRLDPTQWQSQDKINIGGFNNAFYIVIAVGTVLLILGFLGCFGAVREIPFMLIAYFVLVLIILVLEIAAIALVWKMGTGKKLQDLLTKQFKEQIAQGEDSAEVFTFVDYVQKELQCCGGEGPQDYANLIKPASCQNKVTGAINPNGCGQELRKFLELRAGIIGGICVGLILLKIAALVMAACLIKAFRSGGKPCVECAADDVQLSFVPGKVYEKQSMAYTEDETLEVRKKKKQEEKLAKEEKEREAKELKKAEKKRKAEEKKQKSKKDQKETENTEKKKEVPPSETTETEPTENSVESKTESKEKEKQAEQKKLAEEAQRTLEEKRKKREADAESAGSVEVKLETQIV